jgi:membrane associated rhomboid family serine protease
MFPIRDDNPHFLTPYVTYAIIAANFLTWALIQGFGSDMALAKSVCTLGLIPADLLNTIPSGTRFQITDTLWCIIGEDRDPHMLLTSMFMHGGWMHLIGNMWFMWIFGNNVEDSMGHVRFVFFYLLCGIGAAVFQILSNVESTVPMVGASGAIGGVMGAYVMLYPRVHVHMFIFLGFFMTTIAVPAMFMLGYWFLLQFIGGIGSIGAHGGGTAFWAHIGGFIFGAFLVLLFKDEKLIANHPYHGWNPRRSPTSSWRRIDR